MTDVWQWWRDAIAGKEPEIHADQPQCGFYKKRDGKGGKWLPVMIRFDTENVLRCRVGNDSSANPHDVWTWCSGNPVSKEDAKHAFDTGSFPGEVAAIGDNSGDLSLAEQIRDFAGRAVEWFRKSGITDKKSSDIAANYRAELIRMAKVADTEREAEKRPHLEASRAVDTKFKPLVDEATMAANELRDGLTKWMRAEEARLEAEQRAKYAAERTAAEAARKEVEAQRAKQMAEDPIAALTSTPEPLPDLPPPPEAIRVNAGGQRGRKTGLRTAWIAEISDYTAALSHYANHAEVRAVIEKLAGADVRNNRETTKVPGVRAVEQRTAA